MARSGLVIMWSLVIYVFISVPWATACGRKKLEETAGKDYCRTETCTKEARRILDSLDAKVDPCDNFYKFACGDFLTSTSIPSGKVLVDHYTMIEDKIQSEMTKILKQYSPPDEKKHFTIAKQLYSACMNTTARDSRGVSSLAEMLKWLGGWPTAEGDDWDEESFELLEIVYRIHDTGFPNSLIDLQVIPDPMNNTRNVLMLDHVLFPNFSNDAKTFRPIRDLAVDLAGRLGSNSLEQRTREVLSSLQFEKVLMDAVTEEVQWNVSSGYNPMTVAELTQRYPSIPWIEFFQRMLPSNIVVGDDEIIVVRDSAYISKLEKLLNETSKRAQANYLMYRVALDSVLWLDSKLSVEYQKHVNDLHGYYTFSQTWEECVQIVYDLMPMTVSALYVREHSDASIRMSVAKMVDDTKRIFRSMLQKFKWMDSTTRKRAVDKLDAMTSIVGYPDVLILDEKFEEVCDNYEMVDINDYFYQYLKVLRCRRQAMFNTLRNPGNETYELMFGNLADVNSYHIHSENKIVLPMGLLQDTFFNNDRPKYLNYATVGYAIAREMFSLFDFEGRQYDKNGNLYNWWTATTEEKYRQNAQCVVEQYASYHVPEVDRQLDSLNSEVENVADIVGVQIAYLTYTDWVERNGPEPSLPDLPYSPNQLFWISVANSQCAVYDLKYLDAIIGNDSFIPPEFRILGSVESLFFINDFKCYYSPAELVQPCHMW